MCCSKSFRATLICDVLPELSTRKVTWYFKSCRHYNTGSTVRPYLYDTWLALLVKCIFLNKKKGKNDIFIPFIRPPCNIYSSPPPPPKKPYPSPVLTALALNTEAQSIDILLIIIVTPVRQFSWVWDWDVLVWPVNPDWNYKLSNKMLQFAFTAVSYSLLW